MSISPVTLRRRVQHALREAAEWNGQTWAQVPILTAEARTLSMGFKDEDINTQIELFTDWILDWSLLEQEIATYGNRKSSPLPALMAQVEDDGRIVISITLLNPA